MRRTTLISALAIAGFGVLLTADAIAGGYGGGHGGPRPDRNSYVVRMTGFQEVPVVVSNGSGECRITVNEAAGTIDYTMGWDDLEGSPTQGHIHIGQPNVAGGVSIWLCQTATNPAPAAVAGITPTCPTSPTNSGSVSGTVTSANVVGPAGQAVPAGAFGDVLDALRAGFTYCNIHSTVVGGGEVRGQIVH